jgi:hypothetical protein
MNPGENGISHYMSFENIAKAVRDRISVCRIMMSNKMGGFKWHH